MTCSNHPSQELNNGQKHWTLLWWDKVPVYAIKTQAGEEEQPAVGFMH
jgi:hypothetical protein